MPPAWGALPPAWSASSTIAISSSDSSAHPPCAIVSRCCCARVGGSAMELLPRADDMVAVLMPTHLCESAARVRELGIRASCTQQTACERAEKSGGSTHR
jgi:hypothetical protein